MPDVTSPNSDSHFVKAAFPCDRVASSVLLPGIHRPGALQSLVELLLSITLSMNSEIPNIKGLSKFLEFSTEFSKSFHGYYRDVIISKRILSHKHLLKKNVNSNSSTLQRYKNVESKKKSVFDNEKFKNVLYQSVFLFFFFFKSAGLIEICSSLSATIFLLVF